MQLNKDLNFIEASDGRVFLISEFRAYNLVCRKASGEHEILGYLKGHLQQSVTLAKFDTESVAIEQYERFKAKLRIQASFHISFMRKD